MTRSRGGPSLRIALVGTRGVPARYGGFETCVEEVGSRLVEMGHRVVVYCRDSGVDHPRLAEHLGMRLVHLPAVRRRTLETLSHTGLSVLHLIGHRADAVIMFNAGNAPFLPILRAARVPVATHVDGLEWQRAKWAGAGKSYYRVAESLAVRWSDALIADAHWIADYYRQTFDATTRLLTYGAPIIRVGDNRLAELGLSSRAFHLVVARFEPENHVDMIVGGYCASRARLPLVVVGSAPYADDYTSRIHSLADDRVQFLGGLWDHQQLDQMYAHCATYLHGHSVGGTNPSLLRAIGAGAATTAFDVVFNREVLSGTGHYFESMLDVGLAVEAAEADIAGTTARGLAAQERARAYDWDVVARGYETLSRDLASGALSKRRRLSGKRLREWQGISSTHIGQFEAAEDRSQTRGPVT